MVDLVQYKVVLSKAAQKDIAKLKAANLEDKARKLCQILSVNPLQISPPYKKLLGDLVNKYSRRINLQHRLVYEIDENMQIVKVLRMWSHYEN
ncbi:MULTISPECIES: Txe/YoeB family addiction module toxin [unclassified Candidatus Tisiphia]|uniref:Txe/YoeB family addiction module toxin n=1 Tax=unclassified Candidatus Tisiphia TaxID=2996318 RepID=UPI00312CB1CD|nr:Txe/YoeB family addiction module toxin [Rickettsia endosymbiont of Platyusa sonomae]MCC8416429.1 Txe/YoeB family addiction module toxin [Rickettsia endosymbiont of Gnoriste bilineata]